MRFFTEWGKGVPTISLYIFLIYINRARENNLIKIMGIGLALAFIIGDSLKRVIKRARPTGNRLVEEKDFSFPSAHSFTSASLYGGISRVYLGIHYFTDIIGGWSLGLVIVTSLTMIFNM